MVTIHPESTAQWRRGSKPAVGRPGLFVLLLAIAAVGVLILLVIGPSTPLPLAISCAAALMLLVGFAWAVAGPRL